MSSIWTLTFLLAALVHANAAPHPIFPDWSTPPLRMEQLPPCRVVAVGENPNLNLGGKNCLQSSPTVCDGEPVARGLSISSQNEPVPFPNPWWMYSAAWPTREAVQSGDLLLLVARVRSAAEGTRVTVQLNGKFHGRQVFYHNGTHAIDRDWRTLLVLARANVPTEAGAGNVLVNVGLKPSQVEIAGLRLLAFPSNVTAEEVRAAFPPPPAAAPVTSTLWAAWSNAHAAEKPTLFPDYSYSGYRFGAAPIPDVKGPIFDVTRYGAKPGAMVDNKEAIQRAVDAAGAAGGGVVFFPPGHYWVNTDLSNRRSIWVTNPNVVLRGSGMGEGGTVLRMGYHMFGKKADLPPASGGFYNDASGQYLFQLGAPRSPWLRCGDEGGGYVAPTNGTPRLATVTEKSTRGRFTVTVDRAASLKPGTWVTLYLRSKAWTAAEMAPQTLRPEWTKLKGSGVINHQILTITAVQGNRVTFGEPIAWDVDPAHDWALYEWTPVENLGLEDLAIVGHWAGRFVHHRGVFDDGAYSAVQIHGAANAWVRRVAFVGLSAGVFVSSSAATSLLLCRYGGNRGHTTCVINGKNHGILSGLCLNEGGGWHGQDVAYWSTGTVFWRNVEGPDERQDIHMGHVHNTLYDHILGGRIWGNGGNASDGPNHMRGLTYWNFTLQRTDSAQPTFDFDFWGPYGQESTWAVKPVIAGMHGRPIRFQKDQLGALESPGVPVLPPSLFEAQSTLRPGHAGFEKDMRGWHTMTNRSLPAHLQFEKSESIQKVPLFPQSIPVRDLLERANGIEVGFFGTSNRFPVNPASAEAGTIVSDLAWAEQCVFYMMSTVYGFSTSNNSLSARPVQDGGFQGVEIECRTPALESKVPLTRFMDHEPGDHHLDWPRLILLASRLGGTVGRRVEDSGTTVWLRLSRDQKFH